ncbi:MAG TPA: hypothetical protein VHG72_06945 [Polyangia bacterium]|nr:hypothetical protein [Polyangia bacterium]
MKRRAFLRGAGLAGGAALAFPGRRAAAARPGALDRLRQAKIAVMARLTSMAADGRVLAEVPLGAGISARRADRSGSLGLRAAAAGGGHDAVDLFATFQPKPGAPAWSLALALDLAAWSPEHYLLLPGACYAGNRFESRFVGYPPLLTEPADIGPHVPPIVTDIPRLNLHPGPSRLEIAAADLATPAAAVFAPAARLGLIMLIDPVTSIGQTGLTVAENEDRSRGTIAVSAPFWRPNRRASGAAHEPAPPRANQPVTLRARVLAFDCASIDELCARLFATRKMLTGPTARPHTLPFSAAFAAHEARVNARWMPAPGLLAVGARDSAYTTWQTGWCGGLAATFPLLGAGTEETRTRARQTIAFVLGGGQSPAGFFHAVSDGKTWHDDGFTAPLPPAPGDAGPPRAPTYQHPRWHLVRRSADTLLALLKEIAWRDRRGAAAGHSTPVSAPDSPSAKAARLCADALARLWERHRQFGQFVDVESGDLIVGGSTSAGIAPAALARAAAYFKEPRYQEIAEQAAQHFFERFVEVGLTCGGPGDALQCPDSESAAGLLESFVTLYETTRDRVWIDRARATAHLLATWVISYDTPPAGPGCDPGARRATGAVFSDVQNRAGAPGYVLSSGAALFRLYRATGEVAWLELLRDTVHNLAQYLPAPDATPHAPARPDCPRADTAEWAERTRGVVPVAGLFDAIALLAYTEVPGIYAQPDTGFLFAFDHVEARVQERLAGRLVLSLRNPTTAEATVRLFAESAADAGLPLPPDAILEAPTAVIPAGTTLEVAVPPMTARR